MSLKIEVTGLKEFQRALKSMDAALPKQIRLVLNEAGQLIVDYDRQHMPRKSGRAVSSIKARSTQKVARIQVGGSKAPYAPWLDFGGQGKRKGRPAARPFIKEGRYTYQGLKVHRDEIVELMVQGLTDLAHGAGLESTPHGG